MMIRNRWIQPAALLRIGMALLLVASLWRWFVHPRPGVGTDWSDGIGGMLYGLSIGALLLSLALRRRTPPPSQR